MTMLILLSLVFASGFTCGYYVGDRKSKKRRERYLESTGGQDIPASAFGNPRRAF